MGKWNSSTFISISIITFFVLFVLSGCIIQKNFCGNGICSSDENYQTCAADCPPPIQYHTVCQNNGCVNVVGAGANECSADINCSPPQLFHGVCQNNQCIQVSGSGIDECLSDTNCLPIQNCGNGACDTNLGENYSNCPQDCNTPQASFCPWPKDCNGTYCALTNSNYKLGLVYVFTDQNNYNPAWRTDFSSIGTKVIQGIANSTNGKIIADINILGEVRTDIFCWNPAKLGVKCNKHGGNATYSPSPGSSFMIDSGIQFCTSVDTNNCNNCSVKLLQKPESGVGDKNCNVGQGSAGLETPANQCNQGLYCDGITGQLVADCTKCGCPNDNACDSYSGQCSFHSDEKAYVISIGCNNTLDFHNLWQTSKLDELNRQISTDLGFNFQDYNGVFIIFGRLGIPLMTESHFYDYKCITGDAIIGGYSNLIMGEDSIKSGGIVDCKTYGPPGASQNFYYRTGWHLLVHEILHRLGAVDVYDTGTAFGIYTQRDLALLIDSNANQSIMGDDAPSCMSTFDCAAQQLDSIYLDRYNSYLTGLNPNIADLNHEIQNYILSKNSCQIN